jgi:simple sugar transport system ATP-binding protein
VKEAAVVLKYIVQAKTKGIGVIFITHNVHHAWAVGDTFTVLNRGSSYGTFKKAELTREKLLQMMAGGEELEELAVELDLIAKRDPSEAGKLEHRVAEELDREAHPKP